MFKKQELFLLSTSLWFVFYLRLGVFVSEAKKGIFAQQNIGSAGNWPHLHYAVNVTIFFKTGYAMTIWPVYIN